MKLLNGPKPFSDWTRNLKLCFWMAFSSAIFSPHCTLQGKSFSPETFLSSLSCWCPKARISKSLTQIFHLSLTPEIQHARKMPSVVPYTPWTQTVQCLTHLLYLQTSSFVLHMVTWWLGKKKKKHLSGCPNLKWVLCLDFFCFSHTPRHMGSDLVNIHQIHLFSAPPTAACIILWPELINSGLPASM